MFKLAVSITLALILSSCRQGKELKYTTETLDCLQPVLDSQATASDTETLKVLDKYSKDFKFAADLKSNFTDRKIINQAEYAASKGDLNKAKNLLEERIIERGFSETLEQSLNNLDKALKVQKYLKISDSLEVAERVREFSQVKAHSDKFYGKIPEYKRWVTKETNKINTIAQRDKLQLLNSYNFIKDYLTINKPDSLETTLLTIADAEASSIIQGVKDDLSQDTLKEISTKGISKTITSSYSASGKNLQNFERTGMRSLQDQLIKTHLLAKAGQISKTLESLQELQELCEVDEKFRRKILKDLFLAKGWNDASLINRDFLDISYLLETVYKANK